MIFVSTRSSGLHSPWPSVSLGHPRPSHLFSILGALLVGYDCTLETPCHVGDVQRLHSLVLLKMLQVLSLIFCFQHQLVTRSLVFITCQFVSVSFFWVSNVTMKVGMMLINCSLWTCVTLVGFFGQETTGVPVMASLGSSSACSCKTTYSLTHTHTQAAFNLKLSAWCSYSPHESQTVL